jgi:hypothetical protein
MLPTYKGVLDNRFFILKRIGEEGGNAKAFVAWDD